MSLQDTLPIHVHVMLHLKTPNALYRSLDFKLDISYSYINTVAFIMTEYVCVNQTDYSVD
jgi:hypothetical protein